ncbi:thermonuclease family protein [Ectothiorhodospira shaposhnikovii]|uniref:thermonuclease family protein n=1 Tax=Ectothiorhodospira shaposhnikovii TaxID=1054 RepID=UPI001EE844A5|nr:thermonuclease family protein [Ectothiorhodospira shaposhnikovii]MCG5513335.1 thermonuclease family protein [Ectothiorhodospira shaposhnikovii]
MARLNGLKTRALLVGALVAFAAGAVQAVTLPESCGGPTGRVEQARVNHVYDGDTVRLSDGTRVRMIGLDTPEIFWRENSAEPFGHEARDALVEILESHDYRVLLVHDQERRDHYQRRLAHLFTPDGRPIHAELLARGLAVALTIPPNDWNLQCYRDAEAQAREAGLKIWEQDHLRVFRAEELPPDTEGFRRVEGRVVRLGESGRSHWINLEGNVAFRIDHEDMVHFPGLDPATLRGREVMGRGLVYSHRGQPRIRIRHPADLQILD